MFLKSILYFAHIFYQKNNLNSTQYSPKTKQPQTTCLENIQPKYSSQSTTKFNTYLILYEVLTDKTNWTEQNLLLPSRNNAAGYPCEQK